MKKYVIIVAGGKGSRMGSNLPKQFIPIGGKPVLMHTVEKFWKWNNEIEIILVLPADHQPYWNMLCKEIGCKAPHRIVTGGTSRYHSVLNGLKSIKDEIKDLNGKALIAIHDGVRPFVSEKVISDCFEKVLTCDGVVPTLPVIDSLREMTMKGSFPVDRSLYYAVHTPQVFKADKLLTAYEQHFMSSFTDDASVFESAGFKVEMVESNRENIKITTPFDLTIAKALIGN